MAVDTPTYKLLERSHVGPALALDPNRTTLPLTFIDISYAGPLYIRRQFFYRFPYPTHHFLHTTLPSLKHSLSLTLQHFFPLAGSLLCPPPPQKPFIHYTGHHSVTLTVVESQSDNFKHLSANHLRSLKELDQLVPKLSCTTIGNDVNENDATLVFPIVALQVTVFPNQGLCIAVTYCHIIDGITCNHFMKSWASICGSGGDTTFLEKSLPCYNREVIKDPKGLEPIFLRDYFKDRSTWNDSLVGKTSFVVVNGNDDCFMATIDFGKKDIEKLRKWVMNQWKKNDETNAPKYLSKFVVTCGFVWTSLIKTRYRNENEEGEDEYFHFVADCRNRLDYQIPANYFGNCITRCHVMLKRRDLKGEEGFLKAVKEIERAIEDMKKDPFRDAEKWKEYAIKMFVLGSLVAVAGSPTLRVYETDFGFGRPTKVEMVLPFNKLMALAESGKEEGGLEVGLVFRRDEYEYFMSVIDRGLETLDS